jgi:hypothetical protein
MFDFCPLHGAKPATDVNTARIQRYSLTLFRRGGRRLRGLGPRGRLGIEGLVARPFKFNIVTLVIYCVTMFISLFIIIFFFLLVRLNQGKSGTNLH